MSTLPPRAEWIYIAKLAQLTKRPEGLFHGAPFDSANFSISILDMLFAMKNLARLGLPMSIEEVGLLSIAFRSVIEVRRTSWLKLQRLDETNSVPSLLRAFRKKIEAELRTLCYDALELISFRLSPMVASRSTSESVLFFSKMKADYFCDLIEFTEKVEEQRFAAMEADKMYNRAMTLVKPLIPSSTLCGIELFEVLREIVGDASAARRVACITYDSVFGALETMIDEGMWLVTTDRKNADVLDAEDYQSALKIIRHFQPLIAYSSALSCARRTRLPPRTCVTKLL